MDYKVDFATHVFLCGWCQKEVSAATKGVVCACRKQVYCCVDHQRNHVPKHKEACALAKEFLGVPGYNDLLQFPPNLLQQIRLYGSTLNPQENEIVVFGPKHYVKGKSVDGVYVNKISMNNVLDILPSRLCASLIQESLLEYFIPVVQLRSGEERGSMRVCLCLLTK